MKRIVQMSLLVMVAVIAVSGQDQQDSRQKPRADDRQIDQLFDQIMQTIPFNNEQRNDSIGQNRAVPNHQEKAKSKPDGEDMRTRQHQLTSELPEEIRKQVEKAIEEIHGKKEQRRPEFLDRRDQK